VKASVVPTRPHRVIPRSIVILTLLYAASCGGGNDICHCNPTATTAQDFRHAEKHVPLPNITPVETTVAEILSWPAGPNPTNTTPRTGRELRLYHIATAYLQNARLVTFDCDLHLEISNVPDKAAPRVIVETPSDAEYCASRKLIQSQLAQHNFQIRPVKASEAELPQVLPVSVVGLAFRDFEHNRGSVEVATPWELHPAEVSLQWQRQGRFMRRTRALKRSSERYRSKIGSTAMYPIQTA
jgi:hypothetical protein